MSRTRDVIHSRYAKYSRINSDGPIHNESRGMRNRWEEREDESNETESERQAIDDEAGIQTKTEIHG